jgi:hypothetical protein
VAGRSAGATVLWGMVRPRSGAQAFRLQIKRPGAPWTWLGSTRRTTRRGFFSARLPVPRGTRVRVWSPRDRAFSMPVVA